MVPDVPVPVPVPVASWSPPTTEEPRFCDHFSPSLGLCQRV